MAQRIGPQQSRLQDDLRGLVDGDVQCDEVFSRLYATDAGMYERRPLGVVYPRSTSDVAVCMRYAAENELTITARGSGTGVASGSIGPGLLLDMSRYMRRVVRVEDESVRVQSGIVCERLNAYLARHDGRFVGYTAGNEQTTTAGGLYAVDGAGRRFLRYGRPVEYVRSLQVVLSSGDVVDLSRRGVLSDSSNPTSRSAFPAQELAKLLQGRQDSLVSPTFTGMLEGATARKSNRSGDAWRANIPGCGFRLHESLVDGHLDPIRLFAGSEGALGVITEIELETHPLTRRQAAVVFLFDSLEKTLQAARELQSLSPVSCDLVDRRRLSLIRDTKNRRHNISATAAEAALVLEFENDVPQDLQETVQNAVELILRKRRLAFDSRQAFDGPGLDALRDWRAEAERSLGRIAGSSRPISIVDDVAAPPDVLPDLLRDVQAVLRRHKTPASFHGHVGHGQLKIDPLMNLTIHGYRKTMRDLANEIHDAVLARGGRIGTESGCGIARTQLLAQRFPEYHESCRRVKLLLDPLSICGPGKIVAPPEAPREDRYEPIPAWASLRSNYKAITKSAITSDPTKESDVKASWRLAVKPPSHLDKAVPEEAPSGEMESNPRNILDLQLGWETAPLFEAATSCDGCGDCRSRVRGGRMCPIFRLIPSEEASPRAKANLSLGFLRGDLTLDSLTRDELKNIADYCIHCHLCRTECPRHVDISELAMRCKAAHVAAHGLMLGDRIVSRLERLLFVLQRFPVMTNILLGRPRARWLIEKVFGVAQGRKLPRLAQRSYLTRIRRRRLFQKPTGRGDEKVALFLDVYANYFDIQLVQNFVDVLRHNGVEVYIPPRQRGSGTQAIVHGDLDFVKRAARRNAPLFADAVRQGYKVVTLDPASAACFRYEYPTILDDEDATLLAENTSDACEYLWSLHQRGKLQLDFHPINLNVGYHYPCRSAAMTEESTAEQLLRLIPGLNVTRLDAECCGMAGTFGLRKRFYRASLRGGRALMRQLRSPNYHLGSSECCACKIQMEQGASKPTLHPIKLLALAYGLVPEDVDLLSTPRNRLRVS